VGFGSAAKHHQLHCPGWEALARWDPLLRGAMVSGKWDARKMSPRKSALNLEKRGLHKEPLGIDIVGLPFCSRCSAKELRWSMAADHVRCARDQDARRISC